jgi:4-hydroxy-2-oxoheptanedioate aldolase
MHGSGTLRKLRNNEPVYCLKSVYAEPDIVELMGHLNVDVVWICNEHLGINPEKLKNVIRASRSAKTDVMVRRAFGNYDDLIQPLEMGAAGLMIPHCRNVDMVKEIVRQTRFYPIGTRGVDGVSADSVFGTVPLVEYMKKANNETFLMIQIEDREAVDSIEEMAEIEGVDIIFIGPADLSQSLGIPGDFKNEKIIKIIDRTVAACAKNRKWCGTSGIDPDYTKELLDKGVKFITGGSDYGMIKDGINNQLKQWKQLIK